MIKLSITVVRSPDARLTAKLGEKDMDRWKKEDREEMQKEATVEEKIWIIKKERAKRRGEMNRRMEQGQPKKKKLRLKEALKTSEEKRQTENELSTDTQPAEKRKVGKVEEKPAKRCPARCRRCRDRGRRRPT